MASWCSSGITARAASFHVWRNEWNTFRPSLMPHFSRMRRDHFTAKRRDSPFNSGNSHAPCCAGGEEGERGGAENACSVNQRLYRVYALMLTGTAMAEQAKVMSLMSKDL